jgi:outer membrane biosynthesis protein TonB
MRTKVAKWLLAISFLLFIICSHSSAIAQRTQQDEAISNKDIKLVDFAELEYPKLARAALVQGVVVVRAKLDDRGAVIDPVALSGPEALIPACLENARKWRFKANVRKAVIIVYNFRIVSALSKSECSRFEVEAPNFATITAPAPNIQ